jgi:signal transduction histidine kinase
MGIGLSVSRSIIESHGGRLWATPNDGPGITLAFSIPSATEDVPGIHPMSGRVVRSTTTTAAR